MNLATVQGNHSDRDISAVQQNSSRVSQNKHGAQASAGTQSGSIMCVRKSLSRSRIRLWGSSYNHCNKPLIQSRL